ncbi:HD domain-containing protein [Amnibacterium kyonggiense]|uniref:HD domain-containing protein n=1 Tax=Amnibacterium kyonggiense TaxID=595671 RepID=A0A4R7FST3_9MICO|nr:HD domain-containing protein [Amnibacterium kyonggiense]TDS80931.1 HD domain-containing protein [Amnibacterium kyonggiense]
MRIADLRPPETATVRAALDLAVRYLTPALAAHSIRSWYWAAGFAEVQGLRPDRELLAVAALLHDLGLAEEFDAVRTPYEIGGGHVAAVFGAGAGWSRDLQQRLVEVIERHNWPEVDPGLDVEGHLLEIATGLDISGARPDALPREYLLEVLEAYPRGALATDFGDRVAERAERKPTSQAARLVAGGLRQKLAANPLESL